MLQKEWTGTFDAAYRVGDRVTVGVVREMLGDLPDDADLVVSVLDGIESDAPVESVEVGRVENAGRPWQEFARLVARVGFATGGDPFAAAWDHAEAVGICPLGEIGELLSSRACPDGIRCRRCLVTRGLARPAAKGGARRG